MSTIGTRSSSPPSDQLAGEKASTGVRLPTEPVRSEHRELRIHIAHLETTVGELHSWAPRIQVETMNRVVAFLKQHLVPHSGWEERVLYPVVERYVGRNVFGFTGAMRREHQVMGRWINELAQMAMSPLPDAVAFMRRADNLFGLIHAHLEAEEEVVLPILDWEMTAEDFRREVMEVPEKPLGVVDGPPSN